MIAYITKQIFSEPELYAQYDWTGRSITYHRTQIREFFGFREDTIEDAQEMTEWLCQHVLHHDHEFEHLKERVYRRFHELKIVPPTLDRIERLIRSAIHTYEESFFQAALISATSALDTIPIRKIIPAPIAAGYASLIPLGLQKITNMVARNTKMVIPI